MKRRDREGPRRDWLTYTGMTVVAVAAAVISFNSLMGLGRLAGINPPWLLPLSIDGYAVTATRVWLRSARSPKTAAHARRNAYAAIGLSIVGNAAYHGCGAAGVTHLGPSGWGWIVAVAVAAVAPGALGLVAHLWSSVAVDEQQQRPARTPEVAAAELPSGPVPAVPVPVPTPPAASEPTPPAPEPTRGKPRGGLANEMRNYAIQQQTAGVKITGTELDRRFGASDGYGRKILRELTTESNGHHP